MGTIQQHIAAAADADLLARFAAAAEMEDIPSGSAWANVHRGRLVSVDLGGTSVTDVHAYAVANYRPGLQQLGDRWGYPARPGENPSAVTDDQILSAVRAVRQSTQGTP